MEGAGAENQGKLWGCKEDWAREGSEGGVQALTGHVQLPSLGELGVLRGVVIFYSAAVAPALVPVHPRQGEVPLEIHVQQFLVLPLGGPEEGSRLRAHPGPELPDQCHTRARPFPNKGQGSAQKLGQISKVTGVTGLRTTCGKRGVT